MKNLIQAVAAVVIVFGSIGHALAQSTYFYNSHNDLRGSAQTIGGTTYFYNQHNNLLGTARRW